MGSQILRPTKLRRQKGEWLIQGPWGRRTYEPMSKVDLYGRLLRELIDSGRAIRRQVKEAPTGGELDAGAVGKQIGLGCGNHSPA
jgi:hypothetical protein